MRRMRCKLILGRFWRISWRVYLHLKREKTKQSKNVIIKFGASTVKSGHNNICSNVDDDILFILGVIISRKRRIVLIDYSGTRERRAPPLLNSSGPVTFIRIMHANLV